MKKQNVINLIKYHMERDEVSFIDEALIITKYFDKIGDYQLSEYIMGLISGNNQYYPQINEYKSRFLKKLDIENVSSLNLPLSISDDIKGIINAVNHDIGINKFLFEGHPGTGKTEAAKHVARLLNRVILRVDFENIVDSKLGQTTKNISDLFKEISSLPNSNKIVILFDEIDVIALDRINENDVREMGRATSTILMELDNLISKNKGIVIIATTNLFNNFDKALARRFDARINFNNYAKKDLIEVAENYYSLFIKKFKGLTKDTKLFKKILELSDELPYPGELKNIIKTSLAFSNVDSEFDYLKKIYKNLIGDLDSKTFNELHNQGFTLREIEKLKDESKSNISRKLNKGDEGGK
ncbi:ATP-binding protein [Mycoplasma anserisalpingitidis]|uniref:ATP-binding protein n=1 Tax=Mycoplasma anserisalpingitidis TaxID=519450 RepID=UPI0011B16A81|nr:ATP-binding protein [Mycoplasma anserisalpingitidis]QDY87714.1 AAA family ATPase [Mycoplasma anserisalpingitidis]